MKNEPVAWMVERTPETKGYGDTHYVTLKDATSPDYWADGKIHDGYTVIPLYTHPVKELTDEEIAVIWVNYAVPMTGIEFIKVARAILRKASEK